MENMKIVSSFSARLTIGSLLKIT